MTPTAGARQALGARRPPTLPIAGPERAAALDRLRVMFANDVAATLGELVGAGWSPDDVADAIGSYTAWAHAWLAEAIDEGLTRWSERP